MCDLFSRINQICTQMNTNNIFNKIFLFFFCCSLPSPQWHK